MTDNDIHLKLLANLPIHIEGIGNFQLPTLRQVIQLGEEQHNYFISALLFSKESLSNTEDEIINKMSDYELFSSLIAHEETFQYSALGAFSIFMDQQPNLFENGSVYFGEEIADNAFLDEDKWRLIQKVVRLGNFIPEKKLEEEYKAGNERAKKFMEKLKRNKAEVEKLKKKNETINLHSMISAVGWRLTDIDRVLDKTIYQLHDAYYRLMKIDDYKFINTGIYSGSVDGSKIKLPDYFWANVIKNK